MVVAGLANKMAAFSNRLTPRSMQRAAMRKIMAVKQRPFGSPMRSPCPYSVCTSTTPATALIAPAICGETL
ncbi:hypothetical protein ACVWW1_001946 [Bradyrhizobium sp. JR3.5]